MTFKDFMIKVAYLPGTAFSGLVNLLLGSTKRNEAGKVVAVNRGLFGLVLDGAKFVGSAIADFISNHKKAIATAFWASLAVAGAAALTVFLWPAALAAVTTFSIYGLSIAGVVGANTLLQIGAVSALAFAATSVATYLTAAAVNAISAIANCFKRPSSKKEEPDSSSSDEEALSRSASKFSKLGTPTDKKSSSVVELELSSKPEVPHQGKTIPLFGSSKSKQLDESQVVVEDLSKTIPL